MNLQQKRNKTKKISSQKHFRFLRYDQLKIALFHENEAVLSKPLFKRNLTRNIGNVCYYIRANFKDFQLKFSGNILFEIRMLPSNFWII